MVDRSFRTVERSFGTVDRALEAVGFFSLSVYGGGYHGSVFGCKGVKWIAMPFSLQQIMTVLQ